MTDQVRQDVERCLQKAQTLFQKLFSAETPADYARAAKEAFDAAPVEDLWAAVMLPEKIAQLYIAERLTHSLPETDFSYTLRNVFGLRPHQTVINLPLDYLARVTQKDEAEIVAFLEKTGFATGDGKVIHHESMNPGFAEDNVKRATPKPPAPKQ